MTASSSPFPPDTTPEARDAIAELVAIVDRLRDPDSGCPWDLRQTHTSLIPYVLEEAHEVADAIRHGDDRHLEEELGDLLLQVVLHARIASEEGRFDLASLARGISAKLVRRHPHVFAAEACDGEANRGREGDPEAVRRSWEAIKEREKTGRFGSSPDADVAAGSGPPAVQGRTPDPAAGPPVPPPTSSSPLSDRLASKVRGQPALSGAMTISRKAAAAGFEWEDMAGVWEKVHEELDELKEAVAAAMAGGGATAPAPTTAPGTAPAPATAAVHHLAHAQEELGDLLFTLVNVARWCGIDPEEGLAGTNRRFLDRFSRVEAALGGELGGRGLRELERHWQAAKAAIRQERLGTNRPLPEQP
jgi:XTP/dITP diphosphohydrolase